jgi:Ran GTPase-activating protein (RanGAP) involved in mRNA processing and transport
MRPKVEELASTPSPESWRLLCEALDAMPLDEAKRAVTALTKRLEAWPDELRATMCGMSWDDRFLEGRPDPRSAIVRHLRLDRLFFGRYGGMMIRSAKVGPAELERLGAARGSRHLKILNLSRHPLGAAGMQALAGARWLGNLRRLVLDGCGLGAAALRALAGASFFPKLESLSLSSNDFDGAAVRALLASEAPIALASLDLSLNPIGPAGAAAIAEARCLASLASLHFYECKLGPEGAAELARASLPALDELRLLHEGLGDAGMIALVSGSLRARSLCVGKDTIGPEGVRAIARSGWPLRALSLYENRFDDEAARILADADLPSLESLSLDDNDVGPAGLGALLASESLRSLAELSLRTNRLGPEAFVQMGPRIRGLRRLALAHDRIGDDGARALAIAPADALRALDLSHNRIGPAGLAAIARAPWFRSLTELDLSHDTIGPDAGAIAWPKGIERLTLSWTGIGDDGAVALAASPCRPTHLSLDHGGIGDRGAVALAGSRVLERVKVLSLSGNSIGDEGARALARSRRARKIEVLHLDHNRIGDDGAVALAKTPILKVHLDGNSYGPAAKEALGKRPARCCP